jgi:hypothetical protein
MTSTDLEHENKDLRFDNHYLVVLLLCLAEDYPEHEFLRNEAERIQDLAEKYELRKDVK